MCSFKDLYINYAVKQTIEFELEFRFEQPPTDGVRPRHLQSCLKTAFGKKLIVPKVVLDAKVHIFRLIRNKD